jgi:hypothetical protein
MDADQANSPYPGLMCIKALKGPKTDPPGLNAIISFTPGLDAWLRPPLEHCLNVRLFRPANLWMYCALMAVRAAMGLVITAWPSA